LWYKAISPYWQCDRDALDCGHSGYDFSKKFAGFNRKDFGIRTEVDTERFLSYMKTYSAYNAMKKKNENKDFDDPFVQLSNKVTNDLKIYSAKIGKELPQKSLVLKMHFFLLTMKKLAKK